MFAPPKCLLALYFFDFVKKWFVPTVALALSPLNKAITILVEDVPNFKESTDK